MRQFAIEDDVVTLISELAKPEPFESLSDALRRLLTEKRATKRNGVTQQWTVDELFAELDALPDRDVAAEKFIQNYERKKRQRAPSPDPQLWVSGVPELRSVSGLTSWQTICEHLDIEVAGDSARRKLREWVKRNRPAWPSVPDA